MSDLNEVIDRILNETNIVDLMGKYITLKKAGNSYKGLCPFHSDSKTPSLSVSEEKGLFHCFGCKESGNVISFLSKIEKIEKMDAIKRLAASIGIDLYTERRRSENEILFRTTEFAAKFFHRNLLSEVQNNEILRDFLNRRDLDPEKVKTFKIGFVPYDATDFIKELKNHDINEDRSVALNLTGRDSKAKPFFKLFHRLVFPIMDLNNYICAFGGRIIEDRDNSPKYINSSNSPIYNKGNILYGLNYARDFIRKSGHALLVEGYFDHISCFTGGIKNIVATSGTALTDKQANLLKRFTDRVNILYDSDDAGQMAAFRSIEILLSSNLFGKVYTMPEKDPDDFIKKYGIQKFSEFLVSSGIPYIDFFFDHLKKVHDFTGPQKKNALQKCLETMVKIQDPEIKTLFFNRISVDFSIKPIFLEETYSNFVQGNSYWGTVNRVYSKDNALTIFDKHIKVFKMLLELLLRDPLVLIKKLFEIDLEKIPNSDHRDLLQTLIDFLDNETEFKEKKFIEFLMLNDKEFLTPIFTELISAQFDQDNVNKLSELNQYEKVLFRVYKFGISAIIEEHRSSLKTSDGNNKDHLIDRIEYFESMLYALIKK